MSSLQQGRWMVFRDRGQLPRTTERDVPPAEPGPCPGMCASSWLSVGRGGDQLDGRAAVTSSGSATCRPGPVQSLQRLPSTGSLLLWEGPWLLWPQVYPL